MDDSQNILPKFKRSFIPKNLRPNVQGQYYTPEPQIEKCDNVNVEIHECINLLKNATMNDIKDYGTRRKIILAILTNNLDVQYSYLQNYVSIIRDMFPNLPQK